MLYSKNKIHKTKKFIIFFLIAVIAILLIIHLLNIIIEPKGYIAPDYKMSDISDILSKDKLADDDYKTLLLQTGLGKPAIDDLLKDQTSGIAKILEFQTNFFRKNNILCEKIGIITSQESFTDDKGQYSYGFELAPYHNGYILLTKATHSLGWRHGHAAIVVNETEGLTLEAIILGENSQLQPINKWRLYPSFIMLKLKDTSQDKLDEIAEFALNNLNDVPYGLTVGLTSSKSPVPAKIKSTQCSHLVWYPFNHFGYNTDSDGSWLVTPKDIANSDLFEIVQIYGVNPNDIWN